MSMCFYKHSREVAGVYVEVTTWQIALCILTMAMIYVEE